MNKTAEFKQRVMDAVDARRERLIEISDTIHANPEIRFEEYKAAELLSGVLEENGFTVERKVAGLDTSFVGTITGAQPGSTVAILAEYDALPGLGHACGHNIIGTAALGAGLALQTVLPELAGTVVVVGCPAEEGGAGKAYLVNAGVFEGVDAAMMVHPSTRCLTRRRSLTSFKLDVEYYGKPSHAGASPDKGINALDAMIVMFSSIGLLRQQLRDDARVHGIITHGGDASNIIPQFTSARLGVRAIDTAYAREVLEKVRGCAEAGAAATGARLEFKLQDVYYEGMMPSPVLADLMDANLTALGLEVHLPEVKQRMGSTDMGNVSQVVPGLHPYVPIADEGVTGHTAAFEEASKSPMGHEGLILAAKALAMTTVDLLADPALVEAAWAAFKEQKEEQES